MANLCMCHRFWVVAYDYQDGAREAQSDKNFIAVFSSPVKRKVKDVVRQKLGFSSLSPVSQCQLGNFSGNLYRTCVFSKLHILYMF